MSLYGAGDHRRVLRRSLEPSPTWRSDFRRDYARVIHSAAFRRLQGKTQLFAGAESDYFRNRLTHSLEVAQIAKTIALGLNASRPLLGRGWEIDLELVELAALAHDLGHPPFGHTGEAALDRKMRPHGGFEGNAQTLRVIARLEKKVDDPERQLVRGRPRFYDQEVEVGVGLNLCARSIASIVKYDAMIPATRSEKDAFEKGYYASDAAIIEKVKQLVLGARTGGSVRLRTVECQIMEIADDIAYSTYDVEDAFRAGLLTPLDLVYAEESVLQEVGKRCKSDLGRFLSIDDVGRCVLDLLPDFAPTGRSEGFRYRLAKMTADRGDLRNWLSSAWVDQAVRAVEIEPNEELPALSTVRMEEGARARVSVLKHLVYVLLIESPRMKLVARRGTHIVETIFKEIVLSKGEILPDDWAERHEQAPEAHRPRVVCDFIAGMTDRQAIDFYARLRSDDHRTMFGLA